MRKHTVSEGPGQACCGPFSLDAVPVIRDDYPLQTLLPQRFRSSVIVLVCQLSGGRAH